MEKVDVLIGITSKLRNGARVQRRKGVRGELKREKNAIL